MNFSWKNKSYSINRYPPTNNKSLQAWNAADEYILSYLENLKIEDKTTALFGDRFGFLSCFLHNRKPFTIIEYKSQEKACIKNLEANNLSVSDAAFVSPLLPLPVSIDVALVKIPKSLDLFRLYLSRISNQLSENGEVLCGFMTKYFSPQILEIAGEFFEEVEQSKAKKKSRVLHLQKKKAVKDINLVHSIPLEEADPNSKIIQQYFGVFSANNIDYATQFLMDHISVKENEKRILDLACGNGILAYAVQSKTANREIHVLDDSILAIESAKLNLDGSTHFHYNDSLEEFEEQFFDLIVSNPPFHFEHETNIEVSIGLFQQVKKCLSPNGRFLCVANQHLNYKTHLDKIFNQTKIIAENNKYVVYETSK